MAGRMVRAIAAPALALWLVVGALAAEPAADPAPGELVTTVTLPVVDGRVKLSQFLDKVGESLDLNSRLFLMQWQRLLDRDSSLDRQAFQKLASLTEGGIVCTATDDELTISIDRLQMRRNEQAFRSHVGATLAEWFPEQAKRVRAQYVIAIYRADGTSAILGEDVELPNQVVVLIHGLDDPGGLWVDLIPRLRAAGLTAAELSYPNDQSIADSARFVAGQLAQLRRHGARQAYIVAHSMGGLVSREILTSEAYYRGRADGYATGPVVDRLIMVGTPNHGSEMARLRVVSEVRDQVCRAFSGDGMIFGGTFDGAGEAQQDLLPGSDFLRALNARPMPIGVRLTIIAGKASPIDSKAVSRLAALLPGEAPESVQKMASALDSLADGVGDGCVTVASAKLADVTDFHVVAANHISMIHGVLPVGGVPPAIPIIVKTLQEP